MASTPTTVMATFSLREISGIVTALFVVTIRSRRPSSAVTSTSHDFYRLPAQLDSELVLLLQRELELGRLRGKDVAGAVNVATGVEEIAMPSLSTTTAAIERLPALPSATVKGIDPTPPTSA